MKDFTFLRACDNGMGERLLGALILISCQRFL